MLSTPKNRTIAAILALSGLLTVPAQVLPGSSWHLAGLHKFYLGQPLWGLVYLGLSWTPIPIMACFLEAIWYLWQDPALFDANFNHGLDDPAVITSSPNRAPMGVSQVPNIAQAVRELDELRGEGLITEYEFEQKRRALLDQIR